MGIPSQTFIEAAALEEDAARRVAAIMGPNSASAKAIADLERRRAAGENAHIVRDGKSWLVGVFNFSNPAGRTSKG